MKKYYAREYPSEYFNYECYYNGDDAANDNFWAGGNRDFCEINERLGKDFLKDLEHFYDDCNTTDEEFADEEPECDAFKAEITRLADSWLASYNTKDNHFTYEQAKEIYEAVSAYFDGPYAERLENHTKALSVVMGIKFTCGTIRGCCQGDWLDYIAPETMNQEKLKYIEAVLFATGTEFETTEVPIDSADDFDKAHDAGQTNYLYTAKWADDDVKADIARQIGCKPEEVAVLKIKEEHHITTYDYEEV